MKHSLLAASLLVLFAIPTQAEDEDLQKYDKAVLIEVINAQNDKIENLKKEVGRLNKLIREMRRQKDAEPDQSDPDDGEQASVDGLGELLRLLPKDLMPKRGESWETYSAGAQKWLSENTSETRIQTPRRRGQTFAPRVLGWKDGRGEVVFTQAVNIPRYVNSGNGFNVKSTRAGETPCGMTIEFSSSNKISVTKIHAVITDPEIYRLLEKGQKDEASFTIKGFAEEVLFKTENNPFGAPSMSSVVIKLADNPEVVNSKMGWAKADSADKVPELK